MKKGKPEVVQARVDEGMRLKIKKMTEKLDCSEATVIRLALKNFFASSGNKSITL
nr:MAG TPA: antitoxin [Caudoviricetes sp.]